MKKIFCLIWIPLLITFNTFSQKSEDLKSIEEIIIEYEKTWNEKNWNKLIDYSHPLFIKRSGRKKLLEIMNMSFGQEDLGISKYTIKDKQYSMIFNEDSIKYCFVSYTVIMDFKHLSGSKLAEIMYKDWKKLYGNGLSKIDDNIIRINQNKQTFLILNDSKSGWRILNLTGTQLEIAKEIIPNITKHF